MLKELFQSALPPTGCLLVPETLRAYPPTGRDAEPDNCLLRARARSFGELESLILRKESELRRGTWDVSPTDLAVRLSGADQGARRRTQFAEIALLAQVRRNEIAQGGRSVSAPAHSRAYFAASPSV